MLPRQKFAQRKVKGWIKDWKGRIVVKILNSFTGLAVIRKQTILRRLVLIMT